MLSFNEPTTYGSAAGGERKLFGRINPEAYAVNFLSAAGRKFTSA